MTISGQKTVQKRSPRVLLACMRCKVKKRRCNGQQPCQLCSKAGAQCEYEHTSFPVQPESMNLTSLALSCQIEELKQENNRLQMENYELSQRNNSLISEITQVKSEKQENANSSVTTFGETLSRLLTRPPEDSAEYIGTFAVISIVQAIKQTILGGESPSVDSPVLSETVDPDSIYVPPQIEDGFLDKFFSLSHNRGYYLDNVWFERMKQLPITQRTPWDNFAYNIALGIGCRLTELLNVTTFPQPEIYLRRALDAIVNTELDCLQQIQACILIAIFIGRSYHLSFYISSWELAGIAMRKLVQYGYHRKQQFTPETSWQYEVRKRLFWSSFNYEKLMSLSLGRPSSVGDSFIDVPYPASIEIDSNSTVEDYNKLYELQLQQEINPDAYQPITAFTSFTNTSKIRKIESRVHLLSYSVDKSVPFADTFDTLLGEINAWRDSIPTRKEFLSIMKGRESYDYFEVLYHRVKLILLMPNIMKNSGNGRGMLSDEAVKSAARICSSYKNIYRDSILEFSIVALHTVFLAGVTMAYYLSNRGRNSSINLQNDIRACSSLLFIFAERWKEAESYRDLFDSILEQAESNVVASPISLMMNNTESGGFSSHNNETQHFTNFRLDEDFWDQILLQIDNNPTISSSKTKI